MAISDDGRRIVFFNRVKATLLGHGEQGRQTAMTTRHWLAIAVGLTMTLLVEAAQAQSVDSSGIAAASDETRDVNLEADNMEVLETEKKAIFTGNVERRTAGTRFPATG